jgi:excisionase family DNA binding protein
MPKLKVAPEVPVLAFTVPELAIALRCSENKLWAEIASGVLESTMLGDLRRITPAQVERYLRRGERRAKEVRAQRTAARDPRQLDLIEN